MQTEEQRRALDELAKRWVKETFGEAMSQEAAAVRKILADRGLIRAKQEQHQED